MKTIINEDHRKLMLIVRTRYALYSSNPTEDHPEIRWIPEISSTRDQQSMFNFPYPQSRRHLSPERLAPRSSSHLSKIYRPSPTKENYCGPKRFPTVPLLKSHSPSPLRFVRPLNIELLPTDERRKRPKKNRTKQNKQK